MFGKRKTYFLKYTGTGEVNKYIYGLGLDNRPTTFSPGLIDDLAGQGYYGDYPTLYVTTFGFVSIHRRGRQLFDYFNYFDPWMERVFGTKRRTFNGIIDSYGSMGVVRIEAIASAIIKQDRKNRDGRIEDDNYLWGLTIYSGTRQGDHVMVCMNYKRMSNAGKCFHKTTLLYKVEVVANTYVLKETKESLGEPGSEKFDSPDLFAVTSYPTLLERLLKEAQTILFLSWQDMNKFYGD
jgi:hypothetical protein